MTKEQYMTQLKKYLHRLPKQDYEDAVDYFEEYFGEADENGQQELMKEMIARDIAEECVIISTIFWIRSWAKLLLSINLCKKEL